MSAVRVGFEFLPDRFRVLSGCGFKRLAVSVAAFRPPAKADRKRHRRFDIVVFNSVCVLFKVALETRFQQVRRAAIYDGRIAACDRRFRLPLPERRRADELLGNNDERIQMGQLRG